VDSGTNLLINVNWLAQVKTFEKRVLDLQRSMEKNNVLKLRIRLVSLVAQSRYGNQGLLPLFHV
jgi:hypothetical protein